MPLGSPVASSFCASTELPRLIAARSFPVGASSLSASAMAAAENPPLKAAASKAVCRMDMVMVGSPPNRHAQSLGQFGRRPKAVCSPCGKRGISPLARRRSYKRTSASMTTKGASHTMRAP